MNPTVVNIVEQAHMAYLALRTGDYRDLRRAVDHLTAFPLVPFGIMVRLAVHDLAPQEANDALVTVRVHGDEVFTPAEDGLRRELLEVLTEFTLGH